MTRSWDDLLFTPDETDGAHAPPEGWAGEDPGGPADPAPLGVDTYSRAEAIADGELVDVSAQAKETGITWPVALTAGVHALVEVPKGLEGIQDYRGRLHDVLWMAYLRMKRAVAYVPGEQHGGGTAAVRFGVFFLEPVPKRRDAQHVERELVIAAGPGDDGEPVLTIMLPRES